MKFGIPNKDPWEAYHQNQQGNPGTPLHQTGNSGTPVPGIADDTGSGNNPADAGCAGGSRTGPGSVLEHSSDQD